MKRHLVLLASVGMMTAVAFAAQHSENWVSSPDERDPMTFTADVLAVDNVTKSLVASGNVYAVSKPFSLLSELMTRDENGVMTFSDPTTATTCTNEVGHTHWDVTGELTYHSHHSVVLRNAWLTMFDVPILYIPYLWYPFDTDCGIRWMPGYQGRWGGFLLTHYSYHVLGEREHVDGFYWLKGESDLDFRYKQGVAVGERLTWGLGDLGTGSFGVYYAWDDNAEKAYGNDDKTGNWGSFVERERYSLSFRHKLNLTERDRVFVRLSHLSDSYFNEDFMRTTSEFFNIRERYTTYSNSGAFWEHLEKRFSIGAEVSGRLNEFYGMTQRLPEFYLDINPGRLFVLPIDYESQNRIGMLDRKFAKFGNAGASVFGTNPGIWADYSTFRFDTYHRLSKSVRTFSDVLAVVPRVGYHGTYWNDGGKSDYRGTNRAVTTGSMFRSIAEAGVTFAARANGWVNDEVSHMVEPYTDVLAQKAWYSGAGGDARPLVFDNIDASKVWEDQYAGRGRNLPYTYFGITPGIRNAWMELEEDGSLRQFLEVDIYAATTFGKTDFDGDETYGDYDSHKLPKVGERNYGRNDINVMPGARLKWEPVSGTTVRTRAEYDTDRERMAVADIDFVRRVSPTLEYSLSYVYRNHRYWDYSSVPFRNKGNRTDELNFIRTHMFTLAATYQPLDWFALSPVMRWDVIDGELDAIGSWFDFMTDCLGFRFTLEYTSGYTRMDGYERDKNFTVGFYLYLRALGQANREIFSGN